MSQAASASVATSAPSDARAAIRANARLLLVAPVTETRITPPCAHASRRSARDGDGDRNDPLVCMMTQIRIMTETGDRMIPPSGAACRGYGERARERLGLKAARL